PSTDTHYLVLQYAKDGDLRTYLRNNFDRLDWKIKIKMAKDITSGLLCIHEENIVHKDLHSKNILVHGERLLIADLGLSQSLDSNSISVGGGMLAYVTNGKREVPINGTPEDYIKIYSSAWNDDPTQRQTIKNIFDSLENINLENIYNDSNDNQEAFNNQSQVQLTRTQWTWTHHVPNEANDQTQPDLVNREIA
ncbi:3593_t:CDS:2, partial [Diversispora eburnea]